MNPRFVQCYGGALGALSVSGVLGVFGDPPMVSLLHLQGVGPPLFRPQGEELLSGSAPPHFLPPPCQVCRT